nr:hypothetical protein [Planomonospora venezuelensis]
MGVGLIPRLGLDPSAAETVLVPVGPPRPARYVGVATPRTRRSPLAGAVTDALRQAAAAVR